MAEHRSVEQNITIKKMFSYAVVYNRLYALLIQTLHSLPYFSLVCKTKHKQVISRLDTRNTTKFIVKFLLTIRMYGFSPKHV